MQSRAQARQRRNLNRAPNGVLTGANAEAARARDNMGPGDRPAISSSAAPIAPHGTPLRPQAPPPPLGRGRGGRFH